MKCAVAMAFAILVLITNTSCYYVDEATGHCTRVRREKRQQASLCTLMTLICAQTKSAAAIATLSAQKGRFRLAHSTSPKNS